MILVVVFITTLLQTHTLSATDTAVELEFPTQEILILKST
jgi:hypothetical protein